MAGVSSDGGRDAILAEAARRGDRAAFGALYARHHPAVLRYLARGGVAPEAAADLAQEAFADALEHIGRLDAPGHFVPWLYGIARHRLLRAAAYGARHPLLHWEDERERPGGGARRPAPASPDAGPEETYCGDDLVSRALASLNPEVRATVRLCWLQGYRECDAADRLGVPPAAVRQRLHRARVRLRVWYGSRAA